MDTNILLDSGTNELEILEFMLDGCVYGINVAKIREIIPYREGTPVPNSPPSIEGIFMPRDKIITAIDLKACLDKGHNKQEGMFIITNFNKLDIAFHVDSVVGIHRVSWSDIIKPSETVNNTQNSVSTGIIKIENRLITILDFEKIVADINPETGLKVADLSTMGKRERCTVPIMIAEDSALLNKMIVESLKKAGYENIISTENGQQAWDMISNCVEKNTLEEHVQLLITDIEMPIMDGHRLTKLVKSNKETQGIPVVIFSSLVNEEMRKKGEALGADAQLSKPEISNLVRMVDNLLEINQQA